MDRRELRHVHYIPTVNDEPECGDRTGSVSTNPDNVGCLRCLGILATENLKTRRASRTSSAVKTKRVYLSIPVRSLPERWLRGEVIEWAPNYKSDPDFWITIEYITIYKNYLLIKDIDGEEWRHWYTNSVTKLPTEMIVR